MSVECEVCWKAFGEQELKSAMKPGGIIACGASKPNIPCPMAKRLQRKTQATGYSNSYYDIALGDRVVSCVEIIEALDLRFGEGEILKALWRISAYRRGLQSKADPVYDAEKIDYYAGRLVKLQKIERRMTATEVLSRKQQRGE